MKKTYFGFVHKEADGYWIEFPDFAGCFSQGDDLSELLENATAALETAVDYLTDTGKEVPEPETDEAALWKKAERCDGKVSYLFPVTVYLPTPRVRINITGEGDKIEEITDFARRAGVSRSEFLINSALAHIRNQA